MSIQIFASEIPALFDLDKFNPKQDTLEKILNRVHVRLVDDDVIHCPTITKILTPEIQITGKINRDNHGMLNISRTRKNKLIGKVFPNDECLAQVYLWLTGDCELKYTETYENEQYIKTISKCVLFESMLVEYLTNLLSSMDDK